MNVSEGGEIDHRNGEKAREPGSTGRREPGEKREGEGPVVMKLIFKKLKNYKITLENHALELKDYTK